MNFLYNWGYIITSDHHEFDYIDNANELNFIWFRQVYGFNRTHSSAGMLIKTPLQGLFYYRDVNPALRTGLEYVTPSELVRFIPGGIFSDTNYVGAVSKVHF